jgi:hypothetical protein
VFSGYSGSHFDRGYLLSVGYEKIHFIPTGGTFFLKDGEYQIMTVESQFLGNQYASYQEDTNRFIQAPP